MTSEDNYKMHRIIIYSIVFIFEILGLFGNINLIAVILRNKVLRSNFGKRYFNYYESRKKRLQGCQRVCLFFSEGLAREHEGGVAPR